MGVEREILKSKDEISAGWQRYYEKVANRPPIPLLTETLTLFDAADFAIDLGCGTGIETRYMLEQGWRVLATDQQEAGIDQLNAAVPQSHRDRLQTIVGSFETVALPSTAFIWAGLSLPFCPPDHFDAVWANIYAALRPGGRFAGHFFGPNHVWSGNRNMTIHTRAQILKLCEPFEIVQLEETDDEQPTALRGIQRWHQFSVVLHK